MKSRLSLLLLPGFFVLAGKIWAESDAEALYLDALKYSYGLGVAVDEAKTLELYQQAAELGDARALAWKARKMFQGEWGFAKEPEKAKTIFLSQEEALQKMADSGLPDAKRSLAVAWAILFPSERGKQAFEILKAIAREKSALNWGSLAWAYAHGVGVEKNPTQAFAWYRKSAEGGNLNSLAEVGFCYENGLGVVRDEKEAARCYRSAAEKNLSWAQSRLGSLYEQGFGVPKDGVEAAKWYRQASVQGDGAASLRLGLCYEKGVGVEKNLSKALEAYLKAAKAGEFWAAENVGRCYANGLGTEKNLGEARKWFEYCRATYGTNSAIPLEWSLEDYALSRITEDVGETSRDRSMAIIEGLIEASYVHLVEGDADQFQGLMLMAERVHSNFGARTSHKSAVQRLPLGPFDE